MKMDKNNFRLPNRNENYSRPTQKKSGLPVPKVTKASSRRVLGVLPQSDESLGAFGTSLPFTTPSHQPTSQSSQSLQSQVLVETRDIQCRGMNLLHKMPLQRPSMKLSKQGELWTPNKSVTGKKEFLAVSAQPADLERKLPARAPVPSSSTFQQSSSSDIAVKSMMRTRYGLMSLAKEQLLSGIQFENDSSSLQSILSGEGISNSGASSKVSGIFQPRRLTQQTRAKHHHTPKPVRHSVYSQEPRMSLTDSCKAYQRFLRHERGQPEISVSASPQLTIAPPRPNMPRVAESPLLTELTPKMSRGTVYPRFCKKLYTPTKVVCTLKDSPPRPPLQGCSKDAGTDATPKTHGADFKRVAVAGSSTTPARRIQVADKSDSVQNTPLPIQKNPGNDTSKKKLRWAEILSQTSSPELCPTPKVSLESVLLCESAPQPSTASSTCTSLSSLAESCILSSLPHQPQLNPDLSADVYRNIVTSELKEARGGCLKSGGDEDSCGIGALLDQSSSAWGDGYCKAGLSPGADGRWGAEFPGQGDLKLVAPPLVSLSLSTAPDVAAKPKDTIFTRHRDLVSRLQELDEQRQAIGHEMQLLKMAMHRDQDGDGSAAQHHANTNTNNSNLRPANQLLSQDLLGQGVHHRPSQARDPPLLSSLLASSAPSCAVENPPLMSSLPSSLRLASSCFVQNPLSQPTSSASSRPVQFLPAAICNDAFCNNAVESDSSSLPDINSNVVSSSRKDDSSSAAGVVINLYDARSGEDRPVWENESVTPLSNLIPVIGKLQHMDDLSRHLMGTLENMLEKKRDDMASVVDINCASQDILRTNSGVSEIDSGVSRGISWAEKTAFARSLSPAELIESEMEKTDVGKGERLGEGNDMDIVDCDWKGPGNLSARGPQTAGLAGHGPALSSRPSPRPWAGQALPATPPVQQASVIVRPSVVLPATAPVKQASVIVRPSVVLPRTSRAPTSDLRLSPPIWTTLALKSAARSDGSLPKKHPASPPKERTLDSPADVDVLTASVKRSISLSPKPRRRVSPVKRSGAGRRGYSPAGRRGNLPAAVRSSSVVGRRSPLHGTLRPSPGGQLRSVALKKPDLFLEALLEDECALYAGRLQSHFKTPDMARDRQELPDPVARILSEGDEMHFLPICEDTPSLQNTLPGSAFLCYIPA